MSTAPGREIPLQIARAPHLKRACGLRESPGSKRFRFLHLRENISSCGISGFYAGRNCPYAEQFFGRISHAPARRNDPPSSNPRATPCIVSRGMKSEKFSCRISAGMRNLFEERTYAKRSVFMWPAEEFDQILAITRDSHYRLDCADLCRFWFLRVVFAKFVSLIGRSFGMVNGEYCYLF